MPSEVSLTGLSRSIVRRGEPVHRHLAARAVARVAVELLRRPDRQEASLRGLSYGQLGLADLSISQLRGLGTLARAAEFVDAGHALMHRASAVPMPADLDLRFTLKFFDDQDDPDREWIYVLVGTASAELETAWREVRGVEAYPISIDGQPAANVAEDDDTLSRQAVWDRVLSPFVRSAPLSWTASEPELLFDVIESLRDPDVDEQHEGGARVTAGLVVREVQRIRRLAGEDDDVYDALVRRTGEPPVSAT